MTSGTGIYGLPEPALPPRPPSRWRWPIRIFLSIAVMLGVGVFVLSTLGGHSDSLKGSLVEYLSEATGLQANIETLNALSFYPALGTDFDGLTLSRDGKAVAKAAHVNFSTGFWAAAAGHPALRTLEIRDAVIDEKVIVPRDIKIDRFAIDGVDGKEPILLLNGYYGGQKVESSVVLERHVNFFGTSTFGLAPQGELRMRAGSMAFDGVVGTTDRGERLLTIQSLVIDDPEKPITGRLTIARRLKDIQYKATIEKNHIPLTIDLTVDYQDSGDWSASGQVTGANLQWRDVIAQGGLIDDYRKIHDFYRIGPSSVAVTGDIHFQSDTLSGVYHLDKKTASIKLQDGEDCALSDIVIDHHVSFTVKGAPACDVLKP